ncbi:MAG: MBL fold metallo-hydrolase, partial [Candidatus Binatota bacterium]
MAAFFLLWIAAPAGSSCRDMDVARNLIRPAFAAETDATIEYFGHNFFQITTRKGTKIVTDPLAPGMHPTPTLTPHVVTIGREHPNHNYVELLRGTPIIMRGLAHHGAEWNRV